MDQHMMTRVQEAYQAEYKTFQAFNAPIQNLQANKARLLAQIQETADVQSESAADHCVAFSEP